MKLIRNGLNLKMGLGKYVCGIRNQDYNVSKSKIINCPRSLGIRNRNFGRYFFMLITDYRK